MRNGGYRGIYDPSIIPDTRGMHTSRDQFELTKRFDGSWFIDTEQLTIDVTYSNDNGDGSSVNSSNSSGHFDVYTLSDSLIYSTILRSGKFYFEVKFTSDYVGPNVMITVGHESIPTGSGLVYNTTGGNFHYQTNGNLYPGNVATGIGAFSTYPEYLGFAYDTDTGKFWFKANDTWSSQTGDPDSAGAGLTMYNWEVSGTDGNYRLLINHASGSSTAGVVGQLLTGENITMTPPSGFNVH